MTALLSRADAGEAPARSASSYTTSREGVNETGREKPAAEPEKSFWGKKSEGGAPPRRPSLGNKKKEGYGRVSGISSL
jgi:hypothetical protein